MHYSTPASISPLGLRQTTSFTYTLVTQPDRQHLSVSLSQARTPSNVLLQTWTRSVAVANLGQTTCARRLHHYYHHCQYNYRSGYEWVVTSFATRDRERSRRRTVGHGTIGAWSTEAGWLEDASKINMSAIVRPSCCNSVDDKCCIKVQVCSVLE